LWLTDFGIRVIAIAHDEFPPIPCRYHVRRDQAIAELLRHWKEIESINQITLVQPEQEEPSPVNQAARDALDDLSITPSLTRFNGNRSEAFLRALQEARTGGIVFSSARLASKLSFQAP